MLIALRGRLRQRFFHDALESEGNAAPQARHRIGILVGYRINNRIGIVSLKRKPAGQHLVKHYAERPEIRPPVKYLAGRLLGRHVRRGSQGKLVTRYPAAAGQISQAKVHDHGLAFVRQHDVGALDVSMNDGVFVRFLESLGHLDNDVERLVDAEWSGQDSFGQVAAL